MIVVQISDSHIFLPEPDGSKRLYNLQQAVDEINRLNERPDVVLHTGDITHNATREEYQAAHKILSGLQAPLFVIPGNRDRRTMMREIFANEISKGKIEPFIQYKLDQWDTRLILLDTLDENDRLGEYCESRFHDFAEMLNNDKKKPTAIFMHHPPYDVVAAPHPFQFDARTTVERLEKLMAKHPQILGIYCGHSHRATTGKLGAIKASTIPALSIDLRFGEYPESHKDRPIIYIHKF